MTNYSKAIRHFSDDNRVDIINLSFGFPKFHERLRPILTAIRAAREKNVVIFAAAGNEGGNQGISWPAKLYETGEVVCVNASDSDLATNVETKKEDCWKSDIYNSCRSRLLYMFRFFRHS